MAHTANSNGKSWLQVQKLLMNLVELWLPSECLFLKVFSNITKLSNGCFSHFVVVFISIFLKKLLYFLGHESATPTHIQPQLGVSIVRIHLFLYAKWYLTTYSYQVSEQILKKITDFLSLNETMIAEFEEPKSHALESLAASSNNTPQMHLVLDRMWILITLHIYDFIIALIYLFRSCLIISWQIWATQATSALW